MLSEQKSYLHFNYIVTSQTGEEIVFHLHESKVENYENGDESNHPIQPKGFRTLVVPCAGAAWYVVESYRCEVDVKGFQITLATAAEAPVKSLSDMRIVLIFARIRDIASSYDETSYHILNGIQGPVSNVNHGLAALLEESHFPTWFCIDYWFRRYRPLHRHRYLCQSCNSFFKYQL